jgi:hypothetical protein
MKPTPLRKFFLLVFILFFHSIAFSQYWQQQVNYIIDVTLNDKLHELDGFEKLTYTNNSPDTLKYIWFHIWPNAYKNDKTAFSDQLLENGSTKFYFSTKDERGYINRLDFKINGAAAKTEDHPNYIDIIKVLLPKPLPPSQQIIITTPFHVKLPFNFSRSGYDGQSYQVTQWYPKPAVYDKKGWHDMPYLEQGEFYSEFGNYDVRITLPENYVVAATGELQNEEEKKWLLNKSIEDKVKGKEKKQKLPVKTSTSKTKTKPENKSKQKAVNTKTIQYLQNNVHDFAWFANPNFIVSTDTAILPSGKIIDVYSYYTAEEKEIWKNSTKLAKDAIQFYSNEASEYPYNIVSVVQGSKNFDGGMEYPTITVISPMVSEKQLDIVIAHEIGHNWFYGILGTNERDHPWMDEGINSFYEKKYTELKYGRQPQPEEIMLQTKILQKTDQPIETRAADFSVLNYFTVAYHKTAKWMQLLEEQLGKDAFKKNMQSYFQEWRFKHPYPEDFKKSISENSIITDSAFSYLSQKGFLPGQQLKGSSLVSPFKKNSIKNYLQAPSKNAVLIFPALGVNSYDKLMIGALITNYKLPPSPFQFLFAPLYGTGSKELNGLGKLSYSLFTDKKIRAIELFVNGSGFSMNQFTDSSGKKFFNQFQKLVPGIKLTFKEKDPRRTVKKYIQWKSFFINEEGFRFGSDTVITGSDTSYKEAISINKEKQSINRLEFVLQNTRALYPFDINLTIGHVEDIIRPSLTTNYFFNYPNGGGLAVRLFAGKIFYTNGRSLLKSFSTERYHLNMTGANGYEDYTYSNYFLGRNKFEGLPSQQIMIRDGGFKFRTDLLGDKVGKTDRWLAALNFSTTIPDKINPLSVLPIKIPLRIFADAGTYAEAWDRNADGDRFLFDAGLQVSLFKEAINIYIPIVYSKVYSDYYKSYLSGKRFLKNISFSIDLNTSFFKKLHHEVDF